MKDLEIKIIRSRGWPNVHWWNMTHNGGDKYVFRTDVGSFSFPIKNYKRKRDYLTFLMCKNVICTDKAIKLVEAANIAGVIHDEGAFVSILKDNVLDIYAAEIHNEYNGALRYYVCLKLRMGPRTSCQLQIFFREPAEYAIFLKEFPHIKRAKMALLKLII